MNRSGNHTQAVV